MKVEKGLLYTKDHEWLKVEDGIAIIGIADYAQSHLGDIVYVELPEIGDETAKGDAFSAVESVKAAADIYMPVSGVVEEVNEELLDSPDLLNADSYANWMIKAKISDEGQLDELMTSEEYEKFLAEEE